MAYGRLDVYSPDGSIQVFALAESTVSVGRSTGNTIILDNNTISRYHFKLSMDDGRVYLTDLESANGTFVDGVRLELEARQLLLDGDEVTIGNLRIIYHEVDDTPTVKLKPLDDTTQRVEMALANFYIDIQGPEQAVAPGAYISAELVITNTSESDERFRVEVSGPPDDWIRIDRPTPLVAAGETALVVLNFKPSQHSSSTPGDYSVSVRVFPKSNTNDVLEAHLNLHVLPYSAFKLSLEKQALAAGDRFQLLLHNQGSRSLSVALSGLSREQALNFRFAVSQVDLVPGQQRIVEGEVRPQRRILFGKSQVLHFDLVARSQDHSNFLVPVGGTLTVNPLLPGWAVAASAVTLLAISLIIMVILVAVLRRPEPVPQFLAFSLDKTEVARGDVLEVDWQVENVTELRLLVNGSPVATLDPQLVSYDLNTDDLLGEVTLRLEAVNRDQADSRTAQVLVYEPMHVERFDVSPPQLVRNVVQGLDVAWDVPGATRTQVTGLEAFTTVVIAADGPSGYFPDIPGIPTEPLILTLVAEDNYGNVLEHSLTVNLVNPECQPNSGPVQLYIGPGLVYQVVGTIPADATVLVDARDTSGEWLRMTGLAGLEFGLGAAFGHDLREPISRPTTCALKATCRPRPQRRPPH